MGFHKRRLTEQSIRLSAEKDYRTFETYMTSADAYITELGWASDIYRKFGEASETERVEIHKMI